MDTMAALIDKLRKTNMQGQMTGNLKQTQNLDSALMGSYYDAALGRRNQNRQINISQQSADTQAEAQRSNALYQQGALQNQWAQLQNTKEAQEASNKYQMLGLGATALTAGAQFYANRQANENTTKYLDLIAQKNGLGRQIRPEPLQYGSPEYIQAESQQALYSNEPLTYGSAEYNALDKGMGNIYGSEPIEAPWYQNTWFEGLASFFK